MTYFNRRNNHIVEFSGYEEISTPFCTRLKSIINKYVDRNVAVFSSDDPWFVEKDEFIHEIQKEFPGNNPLSILEVGEFYEVFTVVEIFLDLVQSIYYTRRMSASDEILQAFDLSGSVYAINGRRVELRITEDLAKQIEKAKLAFSDNLSAHGKFFQAIGDLVSRKSKPEDIVKDIFVAFEDYLKNKTGAKDYGGAVFWLEKNNIISSTQRALLEKIYAYRSDTYGVGHAGNGASPNEVDSLWFVETVTAQLSLIDRKLKQNK